MSSLTYLDYAATAPLHPAAAEAMQIYFYHDDMFHDANANSLHSSGREAFKSLELSRKILADGLKVRPQEVVFCSGATEANNAIIAGIVYGVAQKRRIELPHVITSSIEHDSVYKTVRALDAAGLIRASYLEPDKRGTIVPEALDEVLDEDTVLVSLMYINNEIGSINNISKLCSITHNKGAYFHTDAVQALGKTPLDFSLLPVDAASFSAHKIGGPKGVGAFYLKSQTPFRPLFFGGGQENTFRSGTQNVCGIAGFAAAFKACCSDSAVIETERQRLSNLRDKLYTELHSLVGVHPSVPVLSDPSEYAPHIVNVCVDGFESETLILQMDLAHIAVSGGSACSSHSLEPSRTLMHLGIPKERAYGSLRISLGWGTTDSDIDKFLHCFNKIIEG